MARLSPSSDISHTIADTVNKYGAGGGASPFATWYENLLVSNQDTSFVGNNLGGGNADFALSMGMPTITPNRLWNVFLNGTVDVFNTNSFEISTPFTRVQVRLVDSAGNAFDSAVINVSSAAAPTNPNSLREQWVDMPTFQIDGTTAPAASGQTANSIILHFLGDAETPDAYWGCTYLAVEIATYTITPSAGANGAISPAIPTTVNPGASQTFTFTPDSGYAVEDVLVDSVSVGAPSSYEFTAVAANHTISVTFGTARTVTTATSGAAGGGSISAPVVAANGADVTITVTANAGFVISSVTVDGTNRPPVGGGAIELIEFPNIGENHSVSARFVGAGGVTTSYEAGYQSGFGLESFAKRSATQAADLKQRSDDNLQF